MMTMFIEQEQRRGESEAVSPPKSVQFLVETGCNLSCTFCDEPSSPLSTLFSGLPEGESWEDEMVFETKKRRKIADAVTILDRLKEWGVSQITFTGGEPTLFPNIIILLKEAKARKMRTALATNGLSTVFFPRSLTVLEGGFLTSNLLDKIAESLDILKLSMHGADEETHDRVTNMHGSFAAVVLNLLERQKYYLKDFETEVTCVVTRDNLAQLGAIVDICCALDVNQLTFSQVYPRGRGSNFDKIPLEQIQRAKKVLETEKSGQLEKAKMKLVMRQAAPSCVLVYPDGEVRVSYYPTKNGTCRVGNLIIGNIKDAWNTFPLRKEYERSYEKNQV